MNCRKFLKLLNRYCDRQDMKDEERKMVREHIKTCASCRKEYERVLSLKNILSSKEEVQASSNFVERVMGKLPQESKVIKVEWERRMDSLARRLIPIPVAVALILAFFILRGYSQKTTLDDYYLSGFSEEEVEMLSGNYGLEELFSIKGGV